MIAKRFLAACRNVTTGRCIEVLVAVDLLPSDLGLHSLGPKDGPGADVARIVPIYLAGRTPLVARAAWKRPFFID